MLLPVLGATSPPALLFSCIFFVFGNKKGPGKKPFLRLLFSTAPPSAGSSVGTVSRTPTGPASTRSHWRSTGSSPPRSTCCTSAPCCGSRPSWRSTPYPKSTAGAGECFWAAVGRQQLTQALVPSVSLLRGCGRLNHRRRVQTVRAHGMCREAGGVMAQGVCVALGGQCTWHAWD